MLGIGESPSRGLKSRRGDRAARGGAGGARRPWRRPSGRRARRVEEVLLAVACGAAEVEHLRGRDEHRRRAWSSEADIDAADGGGAQARRARRAHAAAHELHLLPARRHRRHRRPARPGRRALARGSACRHGRGCAAAQPAARRGARLPHRLWPRAGAATPARLPRPPGRSARLGVLCLDMGAGTTSLAMFAQGHLLSDATWCRLAAITRLSTSRKLCQLPFTKRRRIKEDM